MARIVAQPFDGADVDDCAMCGAQMGHRVADQQERGCEIDCHRALPGGKVGFFNEIQENSALCFESTKPDKAGKNKLMNKPAPCPLTLEGELNKLAANISIGRNMAGVHYYSDYYDSLRMGEEIAIGLLEEQAICYPTDPFVLSVPTFDGQVRRIGRR